MNILSFLQTFALTHNCIFGICDTSPLDIANLQKSAFVPFVRQDIKKRTDPSAILPGAQSIIVVGVGNAKLVSHANQLEGDKLAQLSSLGTNKDYHVTVKAILSELADELFQHVTFKYKILVDSPTLDERAFAQRAGVGFYGRNGLIISPRFGSRFNIGLLLTDIPLAAATPKIQDKCQPNCRLCIDACPNKALQPDMPLDAAKCISYLTQKRELTAEDKAMLHNRLYGCDICQDVCPFNDSPQAKTYVNPQEWLDMDDSAFAEKYGHTAMMWQGVELLRRNAQAVIANFVE
ncbi:MAG: tRNA epoxyqueuosine(34) reductase QueG [Firmicutes bacterium]|nr:tRNA epoxyqueuosine(34) reductase QueG [Bacillota bacterium]